VGGLFTSSTSVVPTRTEKSSSVQSVGAAAAGGPPGGVEANGVAVTRLKAADCLAGVTGPVPEGKLRIGPIHEPAAGLNERHLAPAARRRGWRVESLPRSPPVVIPALALKDHDVPAGAYCRAGQSRGSVVSKDGFAMWLTGSVSGVLGYALREGELRTRT